MKVFCSASSIGVQFGWPLLNVRILKATQKLHQLFDMLKCPLVLTNTAQKSKGTSVVASTDSLKLKREMPPY